MVLTRETKRSNRSRRRQHGGKEGSRNEIKEIYATSEQDLIEVQELKQEIRIVCETS